MTYRWRLENSLIALFLQIEELRAHMLEFLEIERRDFMPQIDIAVKGTSRFDSSSLGAILTYLCHHEQTLRARASSRSPPTCMLHARETSHQSLTLALMIRSKYKSNWQNGALKAQRRNKWCCALKLAMASLQIFGPAGAGNPSPAPADPVEYTLIPYEEVERLKKKEDADSKADVPVTKADVLSSGEDSRLAGNRAVEQEEAGDFFTGPQSGVARRAQTHEMNLS